MFVRAPSASACTPHRVMQIFAQRNAKVGRDFLVHYPDDAREDKWFHEDDLIASQEGDNAMVAWGDKAEAQDGKIRRASTSDNARVGTTHFVIFQLNDRGPGAPGVWYRLTILADNGDGTYQERAQLQREGGGV